MKRRIATISVLVLLIGAASAGALAEAGDKPSAELLQLVARRGLSVYEGLPPGICPIRLSTVDQLEHLLDALDSAAYSRTREGSLTSETRLASGVNLRRYRWREGGPIYYWNLAANVYISSYGSFAWISDITAVRFYLSGITLGVSLTDTWTDARIDPHNGQCATISGGGVIECYVFLQSVFVYYSRPVEIIGYVNIAG